MRREKGSITLFSLISLLLITAALFALLEGTRLQELRRFACLQTEVSLETVFASYNTCLWEWYHLLGTDKNQMKQQLEQTANAKMGRGTNLLQLKAEEVKVEDYVLLTDAKGAVFIQSAATYMRDNWVYEAAKEIYSQCEAILHLMESNQMDEKNIGEALQEVENLQSTESVRTIKTRTSETPKLDVENLLNIAKSWQKHGILQLVIKDTSHLSEGKLELEDSLLKRKLEKGTLVEEREISWKEKMLFYQYLMTYMSRFQGEQDGRALSYELEYLLGAKESDIENLKLVATELLSIREAANFLYLLSSPSKMGQAESAAALLGGASLNPVLIELVKIALLTAWALGESILDVRALLAGKRIPLLKSDETWTTNLENLGEITNGYPIAKETSWGLNYENYLSVLLLMQKDQTVAMRAMSVQEETIRMVYDDSTFRMDSLLTEAEAKIGYSYKPVFPFLRVIDAEERWEYRIWGKKQYGYY